VERGRSEEKERKSCKRNIVIENFFKTGGQGTGGGNSKIIGDVGAVVVRERRAGNLQTES